jgi:NADH-quinone oxidoreductase subunit L
VPHVAADGIRAERAHTRHLRRRLDRVVRRTIGCVQNDIKRIIAYSTCSQLGYMFFAAGVGAYQVAMFHLFTHAFFKALLFLGAGSVIHAMSDEQDIRRMGGIWSKIPVTYAVMWIGSLALAGIPFFAGYYSKDAILEAAFAAHSLVGGYAFLCGILAAFLTAFYSWRLLISPSTASRVPTSTPWSTCTRARS